MHARMLSEKKYAERNLENLLLFFSSTFIIHLSSGFNLFDRKSVELFTSPPTPRTRATIDPPPAKCCVAGQCGIF